MRAEKGEEREDVVLATADDVERKELGIMLQRSLELIKSGVAESGPRVKEELKRVELGKGRIQPVKVF